MVYEQDIRRALENEAGYGRALAQTPHILAALARKRQDNTLPVLNVAGRGDDLKIIEDAAFAIRKRADTLVVVGLGGSSLSGEALVPLAKAGAGAQVRFLDNIDPRTLEALMESLNWKKTVFLVISKSGDTAETLALFLILIERAQSELGKKLRDHFFIVSEPKDNTLRRIAASHGIPALDHDPDIGGRYAALTVVGLLPAKVAGLNIRAIRKGAAEVIRHTFEDESPAPAQGAALNVSLMEQGRHMAVLMPYCDALGVFAMWWRQIWAESLGKNGKGTTPVPARGATDQHSQTQLYLDGPRDKLITLITAGRTKKLPIPSTKEPGLGYLKGRTLGDLLDAESRATAETFVRKDCPLRTFTLAKVDEETIGALMMHFILETIITAGLLGIDAFDQPAVEEGKRLTREYLAKKT